MCEADPAIWSKMHKKIVWAINKYWLTIHEKVAPSIPTYYIRYEDLILDPEPALRELFSLLLSVPSIEGTVVEKRIQDYV